MKRNKMNIIPLILLLCTMGLSSCKKETKVAFHEPQKDISGTWKIVDLTRNGEDMTARINLNDFRIIFNEDSTYSFESKMAFIVHHAGTYNLDDPQYPFSVTFVPSDNPADKRSAQLSLPVREGQRQMQLTFSLGCKDNTYNYTLVKE